MLVGVIVKCMHTHFGGCSLSGFGDIATFKNGQISLSEHGLYSPWSSKNLINRNQLKKFMLVGIDVTFMHANFGGHCLFAFEEYYLSKTAKFPFRGMDYSPRSSKNLINRNWFKKFLQVGIDVTCMHANFGGHCLFAFGNNITSQKRPNFPFGAGRRWSSKNLIDQNQLKKFMQVGIDVTCMHAIFGGCDFFAF